MRNVLGVRPSSIVAHPCALNGPLWHSGSVLGTWGTEGVRVLEGALSIANALGPSQVLTDSGTVLFRDYGLHDHVCKQTNKQTNN